jgi:signal peptide peptidase SppA
MKHYPAIINGLSEPWAILPEKFDAIMDFLSTKIAGISLTAEQIEAATKRATKFKDIRGNVAVLPLYGVVSQKMNLMSAFSGGTSTELFGAWLDDAIKDDSVGAIVLDVDSPGGNVYGVSELSQKIYNARGKKPIIACVNSLCASAAYWIASAADEIVITPSGEVGSIGVLAVHTDQSKAEETAGFKTTIVKAGKHKVEANPHEPLSDEARDFLQARVDEYYDMFTADVARNRGVSVEKVKGGMGEGRVVGANDSIKLKMADKIGTMEQILKDLAPKQSKGKGAMAAELEIMKLR